MSDHILRNARAIIRFFIYYILSKIIKENQENAGENATVTLLWTRNSEVVSKLLTCFISTNELQPFDW